MEDIERVVTFINNYSEEEAVLLPGQIPAYKRDDLRLLLSSVSKAAIHKLCASSCEVDVYRVVSERTFYRLGQQYVPSVLPMKPIKNSLLILKSSKGEIEDKTLALKKSEEHLLQATIERSFYNAKIQDCRWVLAHNDIMELRKPGNDALNSSSDFEVFCNFHNVSKKNSVLKV